MVQKFGGPWSLLKLEKLEAYLTAFNTALKDEAYFRRIYIDAFAGSGDFTFGERAGGFFPSEPEIYPGSARRALSTEPPFHELYFIERDPAKIKRLREIVAEYPTRHGSAIEGDANIEVVGLCQKFNWSKTRGVIFLDPFGNSLEWSTLEAVAKVKLDVWYLFPLSGVFRNLPRDKSALDAGKRATVTKILGCDDWEPAFYAKSSSLFDQSRERRILNVPEIEKYVKRRLETIFPEVLEPRRLFRKNIPLFSLFFALTNGAPAARKVALPIAKHILKS